MYDFNNEENRETENQNYTWDVSNQNREPEKKEKKKSGGFFRKIMVASCCGLCFGLFGGLGLYAVDQISGLTKTVQEEVYQTNNTNVINEHQSTESGNIKLNSTEQVSVITSDYSDVVEDVMPAMVSIVNTYTEQMNYWGQTYKQEVQASGSGIIIAENDTELLIATNNHVVDGAEKLEVTFIDNSVAEAQVKGKDADMDLAVIAIPLEPLSEETKLAISIAKIGDSDALKLGEPVIAIGNALGYGQSVTGGYVSALNREIEMEDGSTGTFIQTDAAINHGNSGGALINVKGEVIGINSSKISGNSVEGMGYAIPISAAEPIIEELMSKETRYKVTDGNVGYIGVSLMTISDEYAYMYNFPQGIFVRDVEANSPAQEAGILKGDIIVDFDGEKIESYEDLQEALEYYAPGDQATITVMRQSQGEYVEMELQITLGTNPNK